jgi:ribosomal-protein-alanine N-acetyltransferase
MKTMIVHAAQYENLFEQAYKIFCSYRKKPWSFEIFSRSMRQPLSLMMVQANTYAKDDYNQVVAFAILSNVLDEIELEDIAVKDDYLQKGAATALINSIIKDAAEHQASQILLEVASSNIAAQKLYKKHGFYQCGLRKGYYQDANDANSNQADDAILMRLTIA